MTANYPSQGSESPLAVRLREARRTREARRALARRFGHAVRVGARVRKDTAQGGKTMTANGQLQHPCLTCGARPGERCRPTGTATSRDEWWIEYRRLTPHLSRGFSLATAQGRKG